MRGAGGRYARAMLERIVAGLDGSAMSERVVEWCLDLAAGTTTEVVLVACYTERPRLGKAANDELRELLRPALDGARARLAAARVAVREALVEGDPRAALIEAAQDEGAALLVVGSRGHSPLADLVLGSVATYLTHHSPLPVAVVR